MAWLNRGNAEKGFTQKHNRLNKFKLSRSRNVAGLQEYLLENLASSDRLVIPRYLFDRFRYFVTQLAKKEMQANPDLSLDFRGKESFRFSVLQHGEYDFVIQSIRNEQSLRLSESSLQDLSQLMYHDDLEHPSDTFDSIIDYHRLFQFTFVEGSTSITSGLQVKKDLLTETEQYVPKLQVKNKDQKIFYPGEQLSEESVKDLGLVAVSEDGQSQFKSRLGHRHSEKEYKVDYDKLFVGQKTEQKPAKDSTEHNPSKDIPRVKRGKSSMSLPCLASDLKDQIQDQIKIELETDDALWFRDEFRKNRNSEIYLGFELLDAIHKSHGRMRTLRLPLYYMKVDVEESGRFLYINLPKGRTFYLNHIGLIQLIEKLSQKRSDEAIERFFQHLLAQRIEIHDDLYRLELSRSLPLDSSVFDQVREVLIGRPGESGTSGIISNLKVIGIECDLEETYLYRVDKSSSAVRQALDIDLSSIQNFVHNYPQKFYKTLLGSFMLPELSQGQDTRNKDPLLALCPGYRPKALSKLLSEMDQHSLLLLEGPPGTGKTFTIMNLFIHMVNQGKRVLIVSDQQAALHALIEKIEEYLSSSQNIKQWKSAIRIVDQVPSEDQSVSSWISQLLRMLALDRCKDPQITESPDELRDEVRKVDREFQSVHLEIQTSLAHKLQGKYSNSVARKNFHPTTDRDIRDLVKFVSFIGGGEHDRVRRSESYDERRHLINQFMKNRSELSKNLPSVYECFTLKVTDLDANVEKLRSYSTILARLLDQKPRAEEEFRAQFSEKDRSDFSRYLLNEWKLKFDDKNVVQRVSSMLSHPCASLWRYLQAVISDEFVLLTSLKSIGDGMSILRQLGEIHRSLDPESDDELTCLALELSRISLSTSDFKSQSIQQMLEKLSKLQTRRDQIVKKLMLTQMASISHNAVKSQKSGTNLVTSITNLLESLKEYSSLDSKESASVLADMQKLMVQAFPVWLCRKQVASFLLPSAAQSFDLVIVDEAGQCRVDDAIPLLHRAKKILVVGDEKQTVLDKNSVVDDFLFDNFELEEQLRVTQARGVKGGGSNLFSLVKSIKQGGVMLDEHYRCPPDIISFSNQYVYDSELKIMQWTNDSAEASVVVDYREEKKNPSRKPPSGKFKGIEVEMIDRFLDFVEESIYKIEKETAQTINVETDVAICYFLLKNEPYIKEKKQELLAKLKRGHDILDGAGAALQGKERKYIFYLWDINKTNFTFFKQGDDPDKRKGELNVLMSRPKVRAYHYLHHGFSTLKHEQSSITDYLWKTYQAQENKAEKAHFVTRTKRPGQNFEPWNRSSGEAIYSLLSHMLDGRQAIHRKLSQFSTVVGDPLYKVDLLISSTEVKQKSVGVIDLSAFIQADFPAQDLVDYYFQLRRAQPGLDPYFLFMHELADERSQSFRLILDRLSLVKKA